MSDPAVDDTPGPPDIGAIPPSRRRGRWLVAAAICLVAVAAIAFTIVRMQPEPTYDDASRDRFVEACVVDGGEPVRPACTCLYTAITEQIPYDRFAEVDDELSAARAAGEEITLPDDIAALVPGCQVPA